MFNAQTGVAVSDPAINRDGRAIPVDRDMWAAAHRLSNEVTWTRPPIRLLLLVEATQVNPSTNATTFLITDGLLFSVDHDADPLTPALFFEFNTGPEIRLRPNPVAGDYARDGDFFTIRWPNVYEFDTGSVISVVAANGSSD